MRKHCNTIPSVINNYTCNPPNQTTFNSTVTGYCSGFMWGNVDESFTFYNQPVSVLYSESMALASTIVYCTVTVYYPGIHNSILYSDSLCPWHPQQCTVQ